MERGFTLVRPLLGGLEGWVAAGYGVDEEAPPVIAIRPAGQG